jgi:hypothetical protein
MTVLVRRRRKPAPWQRWIKPWEKVDPYLLLIPIGLTILGGLLIRSTERYQGWTDWAQHWLMGTIGVGLALGISLLDYRGLLRYHWLVYALTNLSLLAVEFVGTTALGAQRWIPIFGFNVQPSEFAKVGVIISLAALLHRQTLMTIPAIIRVLAITLVPWGLIFVQPDLGTSLVFGAITLGMLYCEWRLDYLDAIALDWGNRVKSAAPIGLRNSPLGLLDVSHGSIGLVYVALAQNGGVGQYGGQFECRCVRPCPVGTTA